MISAMVFEDSLFYGQTQLLIEGMQGEDEQGGLKKQRLEFRDQVFPFLKKRTQEKAERMQKKWEGIQDQRFTVRATEERSFRQKPTSDKSPFQSVGGRGSRRPR